MFRFQLELKTALELGYLAREMLPLVEEGSQEIFTFSFQ
jgi:hypothetical protein